MFHSLSHQRMASSSSSFPSLFQTVLFVLLASSASAASNTSSSSSSSASSSTTTSTHLNSHVKDIESVCRETPYPDLCAETLKHSIPIQVSPSVSTFLFDTIQAATAEAEKLASHLTAAQSPGGIIEKQKSCIQDCNDLHRITLSSLQKSAFILLQSSTAEPKRSGDVNAYLSAALTNGNTCLEGLSTASGPLLPTLVRSLTEVQKHVRNSLAIFMKWAPPMPSHTHNRRLHESFPSWLKRKERRLLQGESYGSDVAGDYDDEALTLVVARDGTGNFTTVSDAVAYAPNNSHVRTVIVVKAGVYEENVDIPVNKVNIMLLGEGGNNTVIRGSRSVADGWTTFRSATVGVSAEGFLARDITIENVAGPAKYQAVALRVNADFAAFYRCTITGFQDTLYTHSFRQFYRECSILGTVDFICGNAAAVLQNSILIARLPLRGQSNVITAQSRDSPFENTGISIQHCSVIASVELAASPEAARTFLGRPWRPYSRTVYLESFLDGLVDPAGWARWEGDQGLDTLYYGEYQNSGPGAPTDGRVDWPGCRTMNYDDVLNFTVSEFIQGDRWVDSTSFPDNDGGV